MWLLHGCSMQVRNGPDGALEVGNGGAEGAPSTRSAPEGSLLNRVEVLEEAMDSLLAAQQVRAAEGYSQSLAHTGRLIYTRMEGVTRHA